MAEDEIFALREIADCLKLTGQTLYHLTQEGSCRASRWATPGAFGSRTSMRGSRPRRPGSGAMGKADDEADRRQ